MDKWSVVNSQWGESAEACMAQLFLTTSRESSLDVCCQLMRGHEGAHEFTRTTMSGTSSVVMEEIEVEVHWRRNQVPHRRTFAAKLNINFETEGSGEEDGDAPPCEKA